LLLGSKLHLAGLHVRRRLDPLRGHKGVEELSLDADADAADRVRWRATAADAEANQHGLPTAATAAVAPVG
jgi:hypothetical protein